MSFNLGEFVKKYDVHPETLAFLKAGAMAGAKPYHEMGVEESREAGLKAEKYRLQVDFDGTDTEIIVPSPYSIGGIPISVYKPTACRNEEGPIILVYFHGGGNVLGCRKTHESLCKILARDAPCIVVNAEYRLAPEHKFPANNNDAKCVVEWVAANKEAVGGSMTSKLGVSGDSSGGGLAAVACHEADASIDFAVLIYPNVWCFFDLPSVEEFKAGPILSQAVADWFIELYMTVDDRSNPRASPLLYTDFTKLPPTMIIRAELDPLRDGCQSYFDKLKEAGVRTELKTVKGVLHGFWCLTGIFKETGKEAQDAAINFIRDFRT